MSRVKLGDRVEIHPHFDLWMQGDRFGTVEHILSDQFLTLYTIRMDKSDKTLNLTRNHFTMADSKPLLRVVNTPYEDAIRKAYTLLNRLTHLELAIKELQKLNTDEPVKVVIMCEEGKVIKVEDYIGLTEEFMRHVLEDRLQQILNETRAEYIDNINLVRRIESQDARHFMERGCMPSTYEEGVDSVGHGRTGNTNPESGGSDSGVKDTGESV